MKKVRLGLYRVIENFVTNDVLCIQGDTLYGYEEEISGCSKTYIPWIVVYLFSKDDRKNIGYVSKESNLVTFIYDVEK
jgi:hypothetical protein